MLETNQKHRTSDVRTHLEAQEWACEGGVRRGMPAYDAETEQHSTHRKLLTINAVAELLDVPKSTLYEAVRQGRVGGVVRLGRIIRFDPAKLGAWLEGGGQALPGGWRQEEAA
jgi:excisionase family DNA binding protein